MKSVAKPFKMQAYKSAKKRLKSLSICDDPVRFYAGVGQVTSGYEECEFYMHLILVKMTKHEAFASFVFSYTNSRSTRHQLMGEFLEQCAPKRKTKLYARALSLFERLKLLGISRDAAAHSILMKWNTEGHETLCLSPSPHVDRKHVAGLPKDPIDILSLEQTIAEITELRNDLLDLYSDYGRQKKQRLTRQKKSRDKTAN